MDSRTQEVSKQSLVNRTGTFQAGQPYTDRTEAADPERMPNVAAQLQEINLVLEDTDRVIESIEGRFGESLLPEACETTDASKQPQPTRCGLADRLYSIKEHITRNNSQLYSILRRCDL